MPKSPEKFKPEENDKERINDPELAEGMAYAEKPYRDESIRRKSETQARYNFIHSDEYREHLRKLEEESLELLNDYANSLDEVIKEKIAREEAWKKEPEVLRKLGINERHKEIERFRKEEMKFDEEKIQAIKERYKRRFRTYLVWDEQRFNDYVQEMIRSIDETEFSDVEIQRAKDWDEGPIPTGIQKAEDYKRTYLRRAKQESLSEAEATKEAVQVRERAREEAEARLEYGQLHKDFQGEMRHLGWEELKKYNDIRNWLNKSLDEHVRAEDYEEALEYVERLKEIPLFNFASWLKARVELKALEMKDALRRRKEKKETSE